MKEYTREELNEILAKHKKWLWDEVGGERADLRYADLRYADLSGANLSGANLRYADLDTVNYNELTAMFALNCPEEGSFIGFKKANRTVGNCNYRDVIVKLQITEDAKRSSATTRKCRCSKAVVLGFYDLDHNELPNDITVESKYTSSFKYVVGETIEPLEPYEENRWIECASGIHFFMTFDEAVNYQN